MSIANSTICAPASGHGGAVALIRISGPDAIAVTDKIFRSVRGASLASAAGYSMHYGSIFMTGNDSDTGANGIELLDDVIVSLFRAPHSYTGEDSVEISCHASSFIVSKILELLVANGAQLALPGEFTQRAFINGKMDLSQAEAVADVISSSSAIEHRIAFNQMKGGYSAKLLSIRNTLLELSALLELELDFSEEEVEFADRSRLSALTSEAFDECSRLAASFRVGNAIKNGVPIAIVGPPNSGKSTLLNALLGDNRAIVSDIPGTTRDTIEDICVIEGIKFRFIDTAGLRETSDVVEKMGIERSKAAVRKAQIVIGLVDSTSQNFLDNILEISAMVSDNQQLVIVCNKVDIFDINKKSPDFKSWQMASYTVLPISAKTGQGLDALKSFLCSIVAPLDESAMLVTNARHAEALTAAAESLKTFADGMATSLPGDLLSEDLRSAIASLNIILGEDILTPQDTLNRIFSSFCIGK